MSPSTSSSSDASDYMPKKWVKTRFFYWPLAAAALFLARFLMAHPLIPAIQAIADPIASNLDLDVVQAVFQTNQSPPVLRLDVQHQQGDTSLEHCEQMSRALEAALEESGTIPDAYVLEVSSPGVSSILSADRDFVSFKGFPVAIQTTEPHKGRDRWQGSLVRRDDDFVHLTQKGRPIKIPRSLVAQVELVDSVE